MSCHTRDFNRVLLPVAFEESLDLCSSLRPVHTWHEYVHEDHFVVNVAASLGHVLLDHLDWTLSISSNIYIDIVIMLQNHLNWHDIILVIVHYHHSGFASTFFQILIGILILWSWFYRYLLGRIWDYLESDNCQFIWHSLFLLRLPHLSCSFQF